jgi:hypothetical protein
MQANRHLPGQAFFTGLQARLRGHERDSGVQGHSGALSRGFDGAMNGACQWLKRHGGKRRCFSGARVAQIWDANPRERPRMTEGRRRRVCA